MFLSVEVRRTQFDQTATQASTIVRVTETAPMRCYP
jgi:hypothetical protein